MNNLTNINGVSCIYEIRNLVNNKIYIGSTNNLMYRKNAHIRQLKNNAHANKKLQRAWNKYGQENFQLDIVVLCDSNNLIEIEQYYLDNWKPEYNIAKFARHPIPKGSKRPQSFIDKIRKANTGFRHTEETKKKMSIVFSGRVPSEETRKLWSQQRKGHERTAKLHVGLVSPDGIIYKDIFNMAKFCREHKLKRGRIWNLEAGRSRSHYGWTLYRENI